MDSFLSLSTDPYRLNDLLSRVQRNMEEIKSDRGAYLDVDLYEQSKKEYYARVPFTYSGHPSLLEKIVDLIQSTHHSELRYDPSEYVYPWVDLRPDGKLQSIYSGEKRNPEDVIQEDFSVSVNRNERLAAHNLQALEGGAAAFKYNCEHVVPQSWFDEREPMRGDLHHLFTCDPVCNSIRSNYPYHDFSDYPEASEVWSSRIQDQCGKAEGELFEPEYAKGTVARAMLYFLLRYPRCIDDSSRGKLDEDLLLEWHRNEPPEIYEWHRNQAIFELQGNRNPFIDFPTEMARVYKP